MSAYQLVVEFGADEAGPWAALSCGVTGCDSHEAVRPAFVAGDPEPREDAYLGMLLDCAEDDGWYVGGGEPPTCPRHGWATS